jgi:hypothetical protein
MAGDSVAVRTREDAASLTLKSQGNGFTDRRLQRDDLGQRHDGSQYAHVFGMIRHQPLLMMVLASRENALLFTRHKGGFRLRQLRYLLPAWIRTGQGSIECEPVLNVPFAKECLGHGNPYRLP